ncbi:AfsR/SARP family transcriptional regulator [Micromonospora endolithica]|uniref:Transcriptional regulator n=1 Tax=Micromonospora endolithica TaxID=230091 RepID=A0A3A9ZD98_9ACTN|nr:BTAD domain-containing putative transcriptional regulator [Micromonospora endolithica]RKN46298.1 transcriptional regulator [Micromonospora endolithica]TWJ24972.1 DNA-binding SARP family transcriptional activator [Micromonospora endolithica]
MEIRVLGELAVRAEAGCPPLGTPKQKVVLAMVAVHAGRLVTVDELVDELWPDQPPRSAVPNVRTYAANLRRIFKRAGQGREAVIKEGDSYRFGLGESGLDLMEFTSEYAEARELARRGDLREAEHLTARALDRWRGRMLAGLSLGPSLSARVSGAHEQRLGAMELLAELRIELKRPESAVPTVREVLALDPLREPAYVLLIRALRAQGDHAGALAVFEAARTTLAEKLGIEPGGELRRAVHTIMDTTHPAGSVPQHRTAATTRDSRTAAPVRREPAVNWLPRPVPYFVGRADLISELIAETRHLVVHTSPVHVIEGMAGSGKTTAAVHLARLLVRHHQYAALFIDLGGHGASGMVDPVVALGTLLRQLGVPSAQIPAEQDHRAELWRRELSRRRSVVVLDNAATSEQVHPLLPSEPGSVVIVTTRRRLDGVDASPPWLLPVLRPSEGLALLESAVGKERISAEPEAAAMVIRSCGYLPLAIRLAGARLAHRPAWTVRDLARLLDDTADRLGHLALRERSVAGAFATSYGSLSWEGRRLFRFLAVHPGPHFTVKVAAAILGADLSTAARVLDELIDCHLVEAVQGGRHRMHDLLRRYSADLSMDIDTAEERGRALEQLLDVVLHDCLDAADALEGDLLRAHVPTEPPLRTDLAGLLGEQKTEWMEEERSNVVALVVAAHEEGRSFYAWRLARAIWRFSYIRAYFDDIVLSHRHGLAAAEESKDLTGIALMNNYIASAYVRRGKYGDALKHLTAAVAACEKQGNRSNLFRFRANLAAVYWLRGDLEEAVSVGVAALRDPRGYGDHEVPSGLANLGLALAGLGRYKEALRIHRLHLYKGRVHRDYFHILNAMGHIGSIKARMGDYESAIRLLRAAMSLRDRTGHRYAEAEVQNDLGVALIGLGDISAATRQHELALRLAIESGEQHVEAAALNDLGRALARSGDDSRSVEMFNAALRVATRISHPYEQGRALAGLAGQFVGTDPVGARRHWERALAIFDRMGVPERFEVAKRLAECA